MDREKLYNRIDEEDGMSDEEKREAYFDEIAEQEAEEEWQDEQSC